MEWILIKVCYFAAYAAATMTVALIIQVCLKLIIALVLDLLPEKAQKKPEPVTAKPETPAQPITLPSNVFPLKTLSKQDRKALDHARMVFNSSN